MAVSRDKLLASKQAAVEAKHAFEARYVDDLSSCAVGLGLNSAQDDWVMKVYAQSATVGEKLPDHFGDFEVDVEVTGPVTAY